MTNAEYLEIFETERLIRSSVVRLLEEQIRVLYKISNIFARSGESKVSDYCQQKAEETKWEAIAFAEYEKEFGQIRIDLESLMVISQDRNLKK